MARPLAQGRFAVLIGLVLLCCPVRQAPASSYYTVTDIGNQRDIQMDGQNLVDTRTGLSYPFVTTTTPLSTIDLSKLPGGTTLQGATYPQPFPYTMNAISTNYTGTVLGDIPSGELRGDPWASVQYGFTVKQPDGTYPEFKALTSAF
jgi:hypothetical protein